MLSLGRAAGAAALLFSSAAVYGGPDWVEQGDAGSTIGSAQLVLGLGQIESIVGTLSSGTAAGTTIGDPGSPPDFEDVYLLRIETPGAFSFQVMNANFDPQLFLFNVTIPGEGLGLLANNDTPMSMLPFLTSPATDGTGATVLLPGVYALGVSGLGRVPVSRTGLIFNFASPTEVSGPDGLGGTNPLSGWTGVGQTGGYLVEMTGVGFFDIPAPGGAAVMLLGLGVTGGRRRRR